MPALTPAERALCSHVAVNPADVEKHAPVAVIIGEAPGRTSTPDAPLFPWPSTSSGGRLQAMSGMAPTDYLRRFARRNLFDVAPASWSSSDARDAAWRTLGFPLRAILCGARVAAAFGARMEPWTWQRIAHGTAAVVIPHPSGSNRAYNDPSARARTRETLATAHQRCKGCGIELEHGTVRRGAVADGKHPQQAWCSAACRERGLSAVKMVDRDTYETLVIAAERTSTSLDLLVARFL